jgi:hypothetical protein
LTESANLTKSTSDELTKAIDILQKNKTKLNGYDTQYSKILPLGTYEKRPEKLEESTRPKEGAQIRLPDMPKISKSTSTIAPTQTKILDNTDTKTKKIEEIKKFGTIIDKLGE